MKENYRLVEADAGIVKCKLDKYFNLCISASRAYLLLRNDYITKPFLPLLFKEIVHNMTERTNINV